jgi:methyl-accepting chemotaxis protein
MVVMAADIAAYLGLVALTETTDLTTLVGVAGKMLILFGAAAYALLAIQNVQRKRRLIAELRKTESQRTSELETAVATMTSSAQRLADAGEELSAVSRSMTGSAERTASQAGTMSSSAEQVSKAVDAVALAVEQLSSSVQEIARHAHEAAGVAAEAVDVADSANATIGKLGDSSAKIGGVIETISTIAAQTNLLALNATIEAARSGEAGRGFAVVASEVKDLAAATAAATGDISARIVTIQEDATAAVTAILRVSEIITRIHQLQATIASAVEEQTATAGEISSKVAEAARSGSEIARGVTAVADAAEGTSAGAASALEAARELTEMAEKLRSGAAAD